MTLYKESNTNLDPVIYDSLEDARRASEFENTKKALYADYMAAQLTSYRYAKTVDTFIKMSETLSVIQNESIRGAILESMVHVLNEIGSYALQMFDIDNFIIESSSDVLEEKVLIPTAKFREVLVSMRTMDGIKSDGLEKLILISDKLSDDIMMRITDNGTSSFFSTDKDYSH